VTLIYTNENDFLLATNEAPFYDADKFRVDFRRRVLLQNILK